MKYFLSIIFGALSLTSAQYFGNGGILGGNPYAPYGPYGQQQQEQPPQTQDYFSGGFGYGYGPSFAAGFEQLQHPPAVHEQQQQQAPYFFGGAPYGG